MKEIRLKIKYHWFRFTSKLWPKKCLFTPFELKDGGMFCKCLISQDFETIYIKENQVFLLSPSNKLLFINTYDTFIRKLLEDHYYLRKLIDSIVIEDLKDYATINYNESIVYSELLRWIESGFQETYSKRYSFLREDINKMMSSYIHPRYNSYQDLYRIEHNTDRYKLNSSYKGDVVANGTYFQLSIDTEEFIKNYNIYKNDINVTLETFKYEMPNYVFEYQIVFNENKTTNLTFFSTLQKIDIHNILTIIDDCAYSLDEEFILKKSNDILSTIKN